MVDLSYYAAKIAECRRLLESSNDPLYRDVYQAMADEFAEKHAALARRVAEQAARPAPPSALLSRVAAPPAPEGTAAQASGAAPAGGERRGAGQSTLRAARQS
jgi:hypothetical protein